MSAKKPTVVWWDNAKRAEWLNGSKPNHVACSGCAGVLMAKLYPSAARVARFREPLLRQCCCCGQTTFVDTPYNAATGYSDGCSGDHTLPSDDVASVALPKGDSDAAASNTRNVRVYEDGDCDTTEVRAQRADERWLELTDRTSVLIDSDMDIVAIRTKAWHTEAAQEEAERVLWRPLYVADEDEEIWIADDADDAFRITAASYQSVRCDDCSEEIPAIEVETHYRLLGEVGENDPPGQCRACFEKQFGRKKDADATTADA